MSDSRPNIIPFRHPKRVIREPSGYINLPVHDAAAALYGYNKIAIVGGPGSGKTYLANAISKNEVQRTPMRQVWCSDVFNNDVPWDQQPVVLSDRLKGVTAWIAEGIAVLRAIRNGTLPTPDCIVLRDHHVRPLGDVQLRLWNTCQRWWAEAHATSVCPVYRIVPMELSRG